MQTLGCLFELLPNPLADLLVRLILVPVVLIVVTPWVLIKAFFGDDEYLQNARNGYQSVIESWTRIG